MNTIGQLDFKQLSPQQKAQLIYSQAQTELFNRLWRAALGGGDDTSVDVLGGSGSKGMGLDSLLALMERETKQAAAATAPARPQGAGAEAARAEGTGAEGNGVEATGVERTSAHASLSLDTTAAAGQTGEEPASFTSSDDSTPPIGLGPNRSHQPALSSAAARTGIPAPALAAIVQAEAAKGRDGSWQCYSRNPRSSAAGLGQFLSGTWEGMAESKGTWLNAVARERGWLNDKGQVQSAARSALLSLRYDANASINTIADYARQNLDGLKRAGVAVETSSEGIARSAYLGHHLGLGDAIRFAKGGLDPSRARMLLGAQIGAAKASARIASAGDATAAHRAWFLDFVSRNLRPERFGA